VIKDYLSSQAHPRIMKFFSQFWPQQLTRATTPGILYVASFVH
jgi:hypothetical protein